MIVQYPYNLYVFNAQPRGFDDDGFALPSNPNEWAYHSKCRDIPASGGSRGQTESGDVINYSYTIVMPLGTAEIEAGTKIKVTDGKGTRLSGEVIRFTRKQLHCRLWV
ncbi:hypothetical protein [Cruoricaptor ignavus]|uniref:hypothetical protein n=1 Tax=Cruoricaptor ignavus TaxID=1118202 RepID=UPI001160C385|nr:hypothetical protein [Cruoricaptor ignavus]